MNTPKKNVIEPKLHSLIFMVGPSGSGKSTLAKIVQEQLKALLAIPGYPANVAIVSSDETRRDLLGFDHERYDSRMLQVSHQAFRLMEEKVDKLMSWPVAAPYIILDATNIMARNRQPFLDICNKNHYSAEMIILDYPDRDEYERFLPDDFSRTILHRGIRNMREKFWPDMKRRAYSAIHKVKSKDFSLIETVVPKLDMWHKTYLPEKTGDIYLIADIHGCLTEFKEALIELGYEIKAGILMVPEEKKNDQIILLGDLIDKGPENAETIDFLYDNREKFHIVYGNHENFIYKWFDGQIKEPPPPEVLERYFTCVEELKDDEIRQIKFERLIKCSVPFVRAKNIFANHAPCKHKYLGKLDPASMKNQRDFKIPRADVSEGTEEVLKTQKEAWEEGLKWWSEQAMSGYPWHFVGHLPLLKPSRVKNQFMIDGGLVNGGTLMVVRMEYNRKPFISHITKKTPTKYPEKLFSIFDGDPRHKIDVVDLDDDGLRRLRFAIENKINFISGTMSPVDKKDDDLESIEKGFEYYLQNGIERVVLQLKYMGSRCNLYMNPDLEKCYAASRGGFKIRHVDLTELFKDQLEVLKPYIVENKLEWLIIDGELLPWHVLGKGLIEHTFKSIEYAIGSERDYLKITGFENLLNRSLDNIKNSDFEKDLDNFKKGAMAEKYGHRYYRSFLTLLAYNHVPLCDLGDAIKTYKKQIELYGQPGETEFKGFAVLKQIGTDGTEKTFFDQNNMDVYKLTGNPDKCIEIDLTNEEDLETAREFYHQAALDGMEGVVMKPEKVYVKGVAPYLKVRNPDYRTIIYGYDYQTPVKYKKLLRQKSIKRKVKTSIAEFEIGKGMLEVPRGEITKDNEKYSKLLAQMIVQEKIEEGIDPRL